MSDILSKAKHKSDENYINSIRNRALQTQSSKLYIFNQFSNHLINDHQLQLEDGVSYKNCKLISYDFSDMKRVTKGFRKVWKYSNGFHRSKHPKKFMSKLIKSKWLA
jgi:hypothetical protein